MADETRRWYADSTVPYALAVLRLFEYAREHRVRYQFGPLDTASMTDGGLVVSGAPSDLDQASRVLQEIPGLVLYLPD